MHSSRRRDEKSQSQPNQISVRYHPEATNELIEAAHFYNERQVGLGIQFLDAIEEAIDFMSKNPFASSADEKGRRKCRIKRYPYLIIYKVSTEAVYILAVAHTSRKPGYWQTRER